MVIGELAAPALLPHVTAARKGGVVIIIVIMIILVFVVIIVIMVISIPICQSCLMSPWPEKVADRFDSSICTFMAMLTIIIIITMELMVVVMIMMMMTKMMKLMDLKKIMSRMMPVCFCQISCLENALTTKKFAHIKPCVASQYRYSCDV